MPDAPDVLATCTAFHSLWRAPASGSAHRSCRQAFKSRWVAGLGCLYEEGLLRCQQRCCSAAAAPAAPYPCCRWVDPALAAGASESAAAELSRLLHAGMLVPPGRLGDAVVAAVMKGVAGGRWRIDTRQRVQGQLLLALAPARPSAVSLQWVARLDTGYANLLKCNRLPSMIEKLGGSSGADARAAANRDAWRLRVAAMRLGAVRTVQQLVELGITLPNGAHMVLAAAEAGDTDALEQLLVVGAVPVTSKAVALRVLEAVALAGHTPAGSQSSIVQAVAADSWPPGEIGLQAMVRLMLRDYKRRPWLALSSVHALRAHLQAEGFTNSLVVGGTALLLAAYRAAGKECMQVLLHAGIVPASEHLLLDAADRQCKWALQELLRSTGIPCPQGLAGSPLLVAVVRLGLLADAERLLQKGVVWPAGAASARLTSSILGHLHRSRLARKPQGSWPEGIDPTGINPVEVFSVPADEFRAFLLKAVRGRRWPVPQGEQGHALLHFMVSDCEDPDMATELMRAGLQPPAPGTHAAQALAKAVRCFRGYPLLQALCGEGAPQAATPVAAGVASGKTLLAGGSMCAQDQEDAGKPAVEPAIGETAAGPAVMNAAVEPAG